jgi:hypothetical protein
MLGGQIRVLNDDLMKRSFTELEGEVIDDVDKSYVSKWTNRSPKNVRMWKIMYKKMKGMVKK